MKRTVGTVLAGVVEICIGLFLLLMAISMTWTMANSGANPAPQIPSFKTFFLIAGAMYGGIGALAIATAIGLFSGRNWARILTLIAGGILLVVGAIAALGVMVVPIPPLPNVTTEQLHLFRIAMAMFWGLVALTGVWWLVLFTRPRIVALFKTAAEVPTESRRPLSIVVIGGIFLFGGSVGLAFLLVVRTPIMLLGILLQGNAALAINLILAASYVLLGIGLLRLDRRAYFGSLGLFAFGAVNVLCMNLLPGRAERMQRYLQASPFYDPGQVAGMPWLFSPWYAFSIPVIILGVPAYFLITRRAAFYKAPQPEVPETLVV
jgi:hypothetical protein